MNKSVVMLLIGFSFFLSFHFAMANIIINEIMYDAEGTDTDREWIEVYNNGSNSVDFTTYKFFEANSNHGLTPEEGDKNIPAGGYAVIVQDKTKFKADYPSFVGNIFRASFSLNNDSEALAIKDESANISDNYTYSSTLGAGGDGKTLQLSNGVWASSIPSPGIANAMSSSFITNTTTNTNNTNTTNTNNTNTNTSETNQTSKVSTGGTSYTPPKPPLINCRILFSRNAFVGDQVLFKAEAYENNYPLSYGSYVINFGDGTTEKMDFMVKKEARHIFKYDGDYLILLEYRKNPYQAEPDVTTQAIISVMQVDLTISKVGNEQDFFVEITNNSTQDKDIGRYRLMAGGKVFVIPANTFVLSKKKIILPGSVTGFVRADEPSLKLFSNNNTLVIDYGLTLTPTLLPSVVSSASMPVVHSTNISKIENPTIENSEYISFPLRNDLQENNLEASALSSVDGDDASFGASKLLLFSGLMFLILLGVGGVYYIQKRGVKEEEGDDFEIES